MIKPFELTTNAGIPEEYIIQTEEYYYTSKGEIVPSGKIEFGVSFPLPADLFFDSGIGFSYQPMYFFNTIIYTNESQHIWDGNYNIEPDSIEIGMEVKYESHPIACTISPMIRKGFFDNLLFLSAGIELNYIIYNKQNKTIWFVGGDRGIIEEDVFDYHKLFLNMAVELGLNVSDRIDLAASFRSNITPLGDRLPFMISINQNGTIIDKKYRSVSFGIAVSYKF